MPSCRRWKKEGVMSVAMDGGFAARHLCKGDCTEECVRRNFTENVPRKNPFSLCSRSNESNVEKCITLR